MEFKKRSIKKKLMKSYGSLLLYFILVFVFITVIIITQLKREGVDHLIQNSINSSIQSIDRLVKESVKNRLVLENDKINTLCSIYYGLYEDGLITEDSARKAVMDYTSKIKSGHTGYAYIINYDAKMVVHPVEKYRNRDFSWDSAINKQIERKKGFLDYKWKNPEDSYPREKILYMNSFEPWEWIVSTTAYSDDIYMSNITIDDVKEYIDEDSYRFECYTLITDGKGDPLVEPPSEEQNLKPVKDFIDNSLSHIKESGNGKLVYYRNIFSILSKESKVIFYSYLPSMDWIVYKVASYRNIYKTVILAYVLLFAAALIYIFSFIMLNRYISSKLTAPLHELIDILGNGEKTGVIEKLEIDTGDEFEELSRYFNSYIEAQRHDRVLIKEAYREIEVLAKFPDENPNPVLRINDKGLLEYANLSAYKKIIPNININVGDTIPEDLLKKLTETNNFIGRNEVRIKKRVYSFSNSRIDDPPGFYLYGKDITRQKKYESLQLLSENIFKNSIEGIVITDPEGKIESINPAFTDITGYSVTEALGKNPRILKSHKHSREFYATMWKELKETGLWSGEIWNRRKDGSVYPEYLTITSLKDSKGKIKQYIAFFHDISEIKEKEQKILYETTHDQLTGLPNRKYLQEMIAEETERGINENGLTLVYLDIKNFKKINESIGADSGDELLRECADRISEICNSEDTLFRIGSDEFAVMLRNKSDSREISFFLDSILKVFIPAFVIHKKEIMLDLSIGAAVYPYDTSDIHDLLSNAEIAMRKSKKDVNNDYIFYSPKFKKEGLNRVELESGLKRAFEKGDFYLNYQPKVCARSGRIVGAESLLRVKPIEGEFVGPDIFIPIAEEMGLIEPLGAWVLERSCLDTVDMIKAGYTDINIAVNLSPFQFRRLDLPNQINNIIESTSMNSANLNLEITESMAIHNVEESISMMEKLTDIGMTLSIDDFGTGYSSLSYLSRFPVNILKIDKAFVSGIPENSKKTGIVMAILGLASSLGMKTVAEGVETREQYEYLRNNGCDFIQGYYFYRPMSITEFNNTLKENSEKNNKT